MSILLVIGGHMAGGIGFPVLFSALGVQVFFVLSGYLITTLLQKEHERDGNINLPAFYRRRCFRIFPAAYAYIIVIALLSPTSRPGLLYAATYTVSYHLGIPLFFQHLWSLSVEEQFYLLWPVALRLGFRHRALIALLAIAAAAIFRLGLGLGSSPFASFYMHYSFFGTMDSIAAGCLLAVYAPRVRERFGWMAEHGIIVVALPATIWTLSVICWGDGMVTGVRSLSAVWGIVPVLIAFWVFLLVERRDWVFNNRGASVVGVLSYSLYLWQQPFLVTKGHSKLFALLAMSGCAVVSYLLVEKPMLKLGASVGGRTPRPASSPVEPAATQ